MGFRFTEDCIKTIEDWDGIQSAPSPYNRKRLDGIKVMENDFIERYFATAHPILPGLWTTPLIGYGLYLGITHARSSALMIALVFVVGYLNWTLLEYMLHRFPFHLRAKGTFQSKFSIFMMHGYHHEFPNDRMRLVAPPLMAWPPAAIIGVAYFFAVGAPYWTVMLAGTLLGYLAYDWTHFYTHHFHPKGGIGKYLRRYHLEHHFKDADTHFGISNPLWDMVLGTYSRPTEPNAIEIELIGGDDGLPAHRPPESQPASEGSTATAPMRP